MIKIKATRKRLILAVALLPFLLLSAQAFGQSAGLSGTVTDATGAVLPGTTVTATNSNTGVKATTTSNNAGIYNFAALSPGTYMVSAEIPGFQTLRRTDVKLDVGARARINFELQVAGIATQVEVTTSAADLLLESTATTGTVMNDKVAKELPLIGNDVMNLVNVMGGVVKPENTIFGNSDQTFAGVKADNINITRDGISVNDARYSSGIVSPSRLNPEMVGEFKLILTPVDAEMGRGAGQVQVLTKSGGNEYHGSGVWSNINTAMDAREWDTNRQNGNIRKSNSLPENQAFPNPLIDPMYKNVNQYTISAGGPIIKNKTFFFASWDQAIARKRETIHSNVLTDCAKKGIYRYWPGWMPSNADATPVIPVNFWEVASTASVTPDGKPLAPTQNSNGTPYTIVPGGTAQGLHYGSVFGPLTQTALDQIYSEPINCSNYGFDYTDKNSNPEISGAPWNALRGQYDTTGFVANFSKLMPQSNYYGVGDGLNVAALQWTRTTHGEDTVYGSGMDSARKSISFKIDHNLNEKQKLSGTYSYEKSTADGENEPTWPPPKGYGGYIKRTPQTLMASLTSTLRPTLLNEFRFGLAYNMNRTMGPIDNPITGNALKGIMSAVSQDYTSSWKGLPVLIGPGANINGVAYTRFDSNVSNFYGGRSQQPGTWGSNDYRWTWSDTLTWTKGSHSFKFGADYRLTNANSQMNGGSGFTDNWFPGAWGGSTSFAPAAGLNPFFAGNPSFPGLVGSDCWLLGTTTCQYGPASGNYQQIYGLMDYMAGSISEVRQYYFAKDSKATTWSDPSTSAGQTRYLKARQKEISFFIKDDWKVNSNLTLNLGVRYEYYGVPHMLNGMTMGLVGGPERLFGGQTGGFAQWLQPQSTTTGVPAFDPNNLTTYQFIGPGSDHPDATLFHKDLNNFGPAVGFAWQLPWFGKGKTTLRGGYQVTYSQISRLDPGSGMMGAAGNQPDVNYSQVYQGSNTPGKEYLNIASLKDLLPTSVLWDANSPKPLTPRQLTDGTATATVYDPNVRSPYVQSLTLALTRQINSSLTLDVRYIGTLSRKQIATLDLNTNNWMNNGLKEAFAQARAGQESPLLNRIYNVESGGGALLRADFFATNALATGNFNEVANVLATSNGSYAVPGTVTGELIRRSGLGENFIRTNRQFAAANWMANLNHSNYHSLQVQTTLRPTHGLSFQATYTWSKNLGDMHNGTNGFFGDPWTDPLNRAADYGILGNNRAHTLTTYGTYNLPIGPLRNSKAWVRKLADGWQLSWVQSATTGLPYSVSTVNSMNGGSGVDLVNSNLFNAKDGTVTWGYTNPADTTGRVSGRFFGDKYVQVNDPQCANVYDVAPSPFSQSLKQACQSNLKALALASDPSQIVFQHAAPGVRGNFAPNSLTSQGRWSLDIAASKNIVIKEGKSFNFRVDVSNILNHPTPSGTAPFSYDQRTYAPGNPTSNISTATSGEPFGYLGYKVGHRVFSAKLRLTF